MYKFVKLNSVVDGNDLIDACEFVLSASINL